MHIYWVFAVYLYVYSSNGDYISQLGCGRGALTRVEKSSRNRRAAIQLADSQDRLRGQALSQGDVELQCGGLESPQSKMREEHDQMFVQVIN